MAASGSSRVRVNRRTVFGDAHTFQRRYFVFAVRFSNEYRSRRGLVKPALLCGTVNHMFTTAGLKSVHARAHSSRDVLLAHLRTMHADLLLTELPGFARPNIRDQMFHTIANEKSSGCTDSSILPMPHLNADD